MYLLDKLKMKIVSKYPLNPTQLYATLCNHPVVGLRFLLGFN